ncbi:DUF885 domain-containing protein [Pacificimonas flava]|uniref:DUF885 domain-containing protein n=2 Tax=Pacificimonas TaxID=1960290 RepID=A0A219B5W3_9SPHN|nr:MULTISPECIES: DUF885 domain-containing protein [Pacificimonas]MBZ6379193.1 DUF885 domain-containing protein [Pacificimonas aurantium]OWV33584.1 DUF885 domain-containing protein [Pacificimonas flava]
MSAGSLFQLSRRTLLSAGAAGAMLSPMRVLAQQSGAAARLAALLERSARADDLLSPLDTTRRDGKPLGDAFVDPLGDAFGRTLEENKRAELAELRTIDRAALSPTDRIAYDVFAYKTAQTLELFDADGAEPTLFEVQQMAPLNPSFGLQVEFPDYMSGGAAPFATVTDYERGLAQLEGFADWLEQTVARLKRGRAAGYVQPRIIVTNILSQVEAMLALPQDASPFYAPIRTMPETLPAEERARLAGAYRTAIRDRVYPGYDLWRTYLTADYLPAATEEPGRWAMKDGRRLYDWELSFHTTTDMSADEIHALGQSEVARILARMEEVKSTVGFDGDLSAFFDHVRTDPKFYYTEPQQLLERFASIEAEIWKSIPKLFHDRPSAPFRVAPLPALGDQRGTGYYRPGPPDGTTPGTLYFNMSMLDTRPIPTLETLTLHEGIPGHHFQITKAIENEDLPPILRFGRATAYTEGWGLYAESLGPELGMFTDPMQLFGHLDMEMLRAVRLVVDTGLHAKGWSRQQAIDFMLANTSMAERDVIVEIDRYISYPGQACAYKIGELTLQRLKAEAAEALGPRYDVRDYHAQVLDTGVLPMAVLEQKIETWLSEG